MTHDTKASVNTPAQRGCAAFSCHAASAENNTALLLDAGLLPASILLHIILLVRASFAGYRNSAYLTGH